MIWYEVQRSAIGSPTGTGEIQKPLDRTTFATHIIIILVSRSSRPRSVIAKIQYQIILIVIFYDNRRHTLYHYYHHHHHIIIGFFALVIGILNEIGTIIPRVDDDGVIAAYNIILYTIIVKLPKYQCTYSIILC